jgi:hypothetical protein
MFTNIAYFFYLVKRPRRRVIVRFADGLSRARSAASLKRSRLVPFNYSTLLPYLQFFLKTGIHMLHCGAYEACCAVPQGQPNQES